MRALGDVLGGVFAELGIDAGSAGNAGRNGMGAGRAEGIAHPATAQAAREVTREPMGMGLEKDAAVRPRQFTGRERQNRARMGREPFPGVVADIVSEMPTRKGAKPTLFLVCIDGVRV